MTSILNLGHIYGAQDVINEIYVTLVLNVCRIVLYDIDLIVNLCSEISIICDSELECGIYCCMRAPIQLDLPLPIP